MDKDRVESKDRFPVSEQSTHLLPAYPVMVKFRFLDESDEPGIFKI